MNRINLILSFAAFLLLSACSGNVIGEIFDNEVNISKLSELRIGMTEDEVAELFGFKSSIVFNDIEIEDRENKFNIVIYPLQVGQLEHSFMLSFADGLLFYWGYPHEYARSGADVLIQMHDYYYNIIYE